MLCLYENTRSCKTGFKLLTKRASRCHLKKSDLNLCCRQSSELHILTERISAELLCSNMEENDTITNVSFQLTYNKIPLTIISIIGLVSNALLLVAFLKDPLKCFRNSGTYLVMNLAVSDGLKCLNVPFYLIIRDKTTKTTSDLIIIYFAYCLSTVSFVSITSISIDRFLMVGYPIKHRIVVKGKLVILWIAAIWIVGCSASLLISIHKNGRNIGNVFSVILIIVSSMMYASTYYKLKKQSRNMALQNSSEGRAQEIRILKEKRFLNTIVIIACVAFICIVPYMIFHLNYGLLNLPKDKETSEVFETATLFILYTNFAVNSFIYILRLPNYRKTFYLLYCKRRTASRRDLGPVV